MNGVAGDPLGPGGRNAVGREAGPLALVESDRWGRPPGGLGRVVRWGAAAVACALVLAGIGGFWLVRQLNPGGTAEAPVNFTVADGDDLDALSRRLEEQGFIVNASVFRWYVERRGGLDVEPGYYAIKPRDSVGSIVDILSTPPTDTFVTATFPEGFTVAQIAERVEERTLGVPAVEVLAAEASGSVTSRYLPEGASSLEGLLFPDTYQISGADDATRILQRMASVMERVGEQENLDASGTTVGYRPYQVLTVASMIEREAKVEGDRALIARVIYNRLALDMNLAIDATLYYKADPALSFAQLKEVDGPYNTYTRKGLPPTPIANPGRASIRAALAPAANPRRSDPACAAVPQGQTCQWLYYVIADTEGRHVFAATYEEHLVNVEAARAAGLL